MSRPTIVDLEMKRGDTLEFAFRAVKTVAGVSTGRSMTGATITMTAKRSLSDPDASAVFKIGTSTGDIAVRSAPNDDYADVRVPPSATDTLTAQEVLNYDVQVQWDPEDVHTLQEGALTITVDVTRTP